MTDQSDAEIAVQKSKPEEKLSSQQVTFAVVLENTEGTQVSPNLPGTPLRSILRSSKSSRSGNAKANIFVNTPLLTTLN